MPGDKVEETWTLTEENDAAATGEASHDSSDQVIAATAATGKDLPPRAHESRKSKAKKVKNYLKRCKGALTRNDDGSSDRKSNSNKDNKQTSSWYLEESKCQSSCSDSQKIDEQKTTAASEFEAENVAEISDCEIEGDCHSLVNNSEIVVVPTESGAINDDHHGRDMVASTAAVSSCMVSIV